MEPTLHDGKPVVYVRQFENGDGIYALAILDEVYIKRLAIDNLKKITIISDNPKYPAKTCPMGSRRISGSWEGCIPDICGVRNMDYPLIKREINEIEDYIDSFPGAILESDMPYGNKIIFDFLYKNGFFKPGFNPSPLRVNFSPRPEKWYCLENKTTILEEIRRCTKKLNHHQSENGRSAFHPQLSAEYSA